MDNENHVKINENSGTINEKTWKLNETMHKLKKNIEQLKKNNEKWKNTMEQSKNTIQQLKKSWKNRRTPWKNWRKYGQTNENDGQLDKKQWKKSWNQWKNWWTVRMRDFSYKMQQMSIFWLQKPRKGAWTTQKKNNKKKRKKCALNLMCSVRFAVWMQRAQQLAAQGRTGVVKPAAQGKTRSLPPPFLRPGTKGGAQCLVPSQVQVPGEAPKEEAARRRGRSS